MNDQAGGYGREKFDGCGRRGGGHRMPRRGFPADAFDCGKPRAMSGARARHGIGRGHFGSGEFDRRRGFGSGRGFGDGPDGGGPRGGRGGGGTGGGRRRRLFDQGELQILLLALVAEMPRHGYDLIREIEGLSGGDYAPSPGVVYPALAYMEEAGLIAPVAGETTRRAYEVTEDGRARALADAERASELKARLSALAARRDKVDAAPVRRAMHALKTAVFDRLSQDETGRDLILKVADAIDEATRKIERIDH